MYKMDLAHNELQMDYKFIIFLRESNFFYKIWQSIKLKIIAEIFIFSFIGLAHHEWYVLYIIR